MGQGGQRGALTWRTLASASEKGAHFPVDRDRAGEHPCHRQSVACSSEFIICPRMRNEIRGGVTDDFC